MCQVAAQRSLFSPTRVTRQETKINTNAESRSDVSNKRSDICSRRSSRCFSAPLLSGTRLRSHRSALTSRFRPFGSQFKSKICKNYEEQQRTGSEDQSPHPHADQFVALTSEGDGEKPHRYTDVPEQKLKLPNMWGEFKLCEDMKELDLLAIITIKFSDSLLE